MAVEARRVFALGIAGLVLVVDIWIGWPRRIWLFEYPGGRCFTYPHVGPTTCLSNLEFYAICAGIVGLHLTAVWLYVSRRMSQRIR